MRIDSAVLQQCYWLQRYTATWHLFFLSPFQECCRFRLSPYDFIATCLITVLPMFSYPGFQQAEEAFTWMHIHQTWLDGLEAKDQTNWFL